MEKALEMIKKLAKKIDYKPHYLIGIARGGLIPLRFLSDMLHNPNIAVLRIEFYKKIGETHDSPKITQDIGIDIKEKKVLLVDDVADSGRSLAVAKEHLYKKGASEVRCATLHYKPSSVVKPEYFVEKTEKWIVYPWEVEETKKELGKKSF